MRRYMLFALALAVAVPISDTAFASSAPSFDINSLITAAAADVEAARKDAVAHNDTIAAQCYAGDEAYIAANPISAPSFGNVQGVVSGFQAARDAVKSIQGAAATGLLPTPIIKACGALFLDVQNDIGKAAAGGISIFGIKF